MMIKKLLITLSLVLVLSSPSFAMGEFDFLPSFGVRMGADFGFTTWNNNALPPRLAGGIFFDNYLTVIGDSLFTLGTNVHFSTLAQTTIELDQSPITLQWHEFSADIMLKIQLFYLVYLGIGGGMVINTPAKVTKGDSSRIGETRSSIQPIFTWEVGGNILIGFWDINPKHWREHWIALNIAVRGTVNPMARKLDLHRFSSTHSIGLYLGISILPDAMPV